MMKEKQVKINAEEFAYRFMETVQRSNLNVEDMEKASKEALAAYLTGYYLIQKFNHLENDLFIEDHKKPVSKYQQILSELNKY